MKRLISIILISISIFALCSCANLEEYTDVDEFIPMLEDLLDEGWDDANKVIKSDDGKTLTIEVWGEGVSVIAVEAAKGDQEALAYWYKLGNQLKGVAQDTYDLAKDNCDDDIEIVFSYVDEFNQDTVLLSYDGDGNLVRDIVAESQGY